MTNTPTVHCFCARYESLGFAGFGDALVELSPTELDLLVEVSGWPARREGEDGSVWVDVLNDLCMLLDGHTGPHEFESTDSVVLIFPKEETC